MMAGFDHHAMCTRCRDKKKGSDPCTKSPPASCVHCDALTPEQKDQLATPSYKIKKEKKEAKSSTPLKESDTLSPTLVDPALVSVVGVVDGQSTSGVSGLSGSVEKKAKKAEAKHPTKAKFDKPTKSTSSRPLTSSTDQGKSTTSTTDTKIADLDKKWSDRFNQLEALLLAKTLDPPRDPVFSTVKVLPPRAPPANVVRTDPFLKPASQLTDQAVESPATDSSHHKAGPKASSSAQPDPPTSVTAHRQLSTAFDVSRKESLSSSDSDSDSLSSDRPPWTSYRKKVNCRTIRKLTYLIRNSLCPKNNLELEGIY